ncbi:diguanylate cyclase [Aquabacter sp. CN5-332]|uniref:sensor domain-containing diguanylate cyclase n=1 Tax=Aquabacter sp. CN5-332 TaxID=3156608 RepID=UPI0032B3A986
MSIRRRIAWLIILVAVPIFIERVIALFTEREQLIQATIAQLHETAQVVGLAQRENIATAVAITQTLARQASALMADTTACDALLRRLSGDVLGIQGAWIGTVQGRVRCASTRGLLEADLSDRDYVRDALRSTQPILSNFIVARNTARSVLVVAEAERNMAGDPVAVVAVGLDLQWMSRLAGQAGMQAGVTVLVVDGGGTILARHPALANVVGRSYPGHPLVRQIMGTDEGSVETAGFDGVERYYAFVRMPGTDVRVLVGIERADAVAAIDRRILTVLGGLLVGIILLTCIALYAADRMIVGPVNQLARDILAVGRDEAPNIGEADVEEFQPVVQAFDEMNRRLNERTSELRNLNGRLTALASTDGLTGLANRRTFDVQFSDEWVQSADARRPLALVMTDVDSFKLFNDTMGHLAGDEALRSVARMLAASVAGTPNLAARYGGEEFVVLLPNTDVAGAVEFAEDVRRLVAALGIDHPKAPMGRLTASFGAASIIPGPGDSPDALLASADAALYEAKRLGRNRVVGARASDGEARSA